jgi:deoxycytidylate deaminase
MGRLPKILSDEYYLTCISEAIKSRGKHERYGSLLVKDGKAIGRGFNRAIANGLINLDREIRQGYANHAEIEAMNDALFKGFDISNSDIFCAGYFPKTGKLFFQQDYTCTLCPKKMHPYGVKNIVIPTKNGWKIRPLEEAVEEARKFTKGTHEKRIRITEGEYYISQLAF